MAEQLDGILNKLSNDIDTSASDTRGVLKDLIKKGKVLPGKWSNKKIDSASDIEIENLYSEYIQRENKHKAENTGKAVGKHVISLYCNGVSRVLKIDDINHLKMDIDEDPIIKDSMAEIGGLLVFTFGRWLAPLLVAAHTANHTQGFVRDEIEIKDDEATEGSTDAEN